MKDQILKIVGAVVVALLAVIGIGLLAAWPVKALWNDCLVGTISGIGPITSIWHAWGVLVISGILFRGFYSSK